MTPRPWAPPRLAESWGVGRVSSSDGQRFGIQASSLLASFYPRYFGYYDRAVTVYTHVSDQHSVFASRAIACSAREATYVLDGFLENDTILRPREHMTDTHGFTEQLFALCYLLGFFFMPRLKDLKHQRLYKLNRSLSYGEIDPLFRGAPIDADLIREQWDNLVHVAASVRDRTAPAHVIQQRLGASPSDRLSKAFTALGRLLKTIHLLRYTAAPATPSSPGDVVTLAERAVEICGETEGALPVQSQNAMHALGVVGVPRDDGLRATRVSANRESNAASHHRDRGGATTPFSRARGVAVGALDALPRGRRCRGTRTAIGRSGRVPRSPVGRREGDARSPCDRGKGGTGGGGRHDRPCYLRGKPRRRRRVGEALRAEAARRARGAP
ncbi:MAG: Tn3 family transposase [Polyangiaceae bacterium]